MRSRWKVQESLQAPCNLAFIKIDIFENFLAKFEELEKIEQNSMKKEKQPTEKKSSEMKQFNKLIKEQLNYIEHRFEHLGVLEKMITYEKKQLEVFGL